MNGDYVTQVQFQGTMALLQEIRADIKGDVADVHQDLLLMKKEITDRQDEANHRTDKNEEAVLAAKVQIEVVQATVTRIAKHGCENLAPHKAALGALEAAGVTPSSSGWKPTPRQIGVGAGLAGAGALVFKLAEVVHQWYVTLHTVTK